MNDDTMRVDPGRQAPIRERWLLLALLAGLVAWWWALPDPFYLPNNDYYSFERTARSLAAFELPESFKRLPIFPALMALLAPLMPGEQPWLAAARLLNAGFSLGLLLLLFDFSARLMRRGAILPVVLLAINPVFQSMGLQPLVEPSMGFFVVLAFWLCARRSDWMYAAAAAAALSRYEVGVIVPVLVLSGLWQGRDRRRQLLLGALACLPVFLWALLDLAYGEPGSNNYLELMQAGGFRPEWAFIHSSLKQPFEGWYRGWDDQLHWFLLVVCLPLAAGLRAAWRSARPLTLALILFYLGQVGLVMAFGIDKARYVYPSQWIAILFFALGLREIGLGWIPRGLERLPRAASLLVAAGALILAASMIRIWAGKLGGTQSDVSPRLEWTWIGFCLLLVAIWALTEARRRSLPALAGASLLVAVCLPSLAGGATLARYELNEVRYDNWELKLLSDWIEAELPEGSRIVVMHPSHVRFLTGLPAQRLAAFGDFEAPADDFAAFTEEMRRRGFDHAAYTFRAPPDDDSGRAYHAENKFALAEVLAPGQPLPGWRKVASLPVPAWLEHSDVQIYRLEAP